jgi:biopolymer transport protein ExbD
MALSVRAGQTAVKSEPNVVPMIDIMLVLLIIFMIVTPLIAAGFKATLPKGKNLDPRPEGDNEVVLGIDEAGRYFLDGRPIPEANLEDQLRSMFAARTEDKILYFKADNQLKFGKIQEAVETARRSGVRVMAAITRTPDRRAVSTASWILPYLSWLSALK